MCRKIVAGLNLPLSPLTYLTWNMFGKGFLEAHSFETHPNERMWVKLQPTPFFGWTVMSLIDSTDFRISGAFYPPEDSQDMTLDWREVSVKKSNQKVDREGNPVIVYIYIYSHAIAYNSVYLHLKSQKIYIIEYLQFLHSGERWAEPSIGYMNIFVYNNTLTSYCYYTLQSKSEEKVFWILNPAVVPILDSS